VAEAATAARQATIVHEYRTTNEVRNDRRFHAPMSLRATHRSGHGLPKAAITPTRSSPSTYPKTETYERAHNEKPLDTDPGDAPNPLGEPAAERDSRSPPSNHTRTCNKLPDVYM